MKDVFGYVDRNFDRFVEELAELIRIPSVSAQKRGLEECARHIVRRLQEVGLHAESIPMGGPDNPPLVYGRLDVPRAKRTLFIYGHFDVQPPEPLEAWETPPFEPTIRNGRMYGRGTGDNKGQFYAHIKAIEALQKARGGVPLNLRILLDPQEEIGSPMMESFLNSHGDLFQADFGYKPDGQAAVGNIPTVNFGNRGSCYVEVRVRAGNRDTHSGNFGGPMPNAAWRLVEFLQTLRDDKGRPAIEGFFDNVLPPTKAERAALDVLPFDRQAWLREMGLSREAGPPEMSHYEKIMFQPTLNICGITSGYGGPGTKTVIPCQAMAKIDMRLVKNQTPPEILEKFRAHARKYGFDDVEVIPHLQYYPSRTPVDHPMSKVVIAAVREVFGQEPLIYPSIGGSNPSYLFHENLGIPLAQVPYANFDESNHAPNENLLLDFFRMGVKTTAKVMCGLAAL
jgi:acetylornithine deacetylase/succinyl-diaminopimelate desuccinylase-like protein